MPRVRRLKMKAKLEAMVEGLKSDLCLDCGKRFHSSAMHFDHRPGESKKGHTRGLLDRVASEDVIRAEIAKCDLVYVGCHRIRTVSRLGEPTLRSCKGHLVFQTDCRMYGIADRRHTRSTSLRRQIDVMKNAPFSHCHTSHAPFLMDWDHRPGEQKAFTVAQGVSSGWKLGRILLGSRNVTSSVFGAMSTELNLGR